ncbi:MAG: 30S ribosomal protein S20 [Candidatus Dadabacteria bacterium]|nr:MAG: 30S ribosomal protein S20 [Candidatus Dadabacteria bacterium]
MANHKSALKRHRQSLKRRERNRRVKSSIRTAIKKARLAIEAGEEGAIELVRRAEKLLASSATKGVIHKKNAARRISRLAKRLNKAKS